MKLKMDQRIYISSTLLAFGLVVANFGLLLAVDEQVRLANVL